MPTDHPGKRAPTEFSFESYVERQFILLHERLDEEMSDIQGLQADADTIATALPEIATALANSTAGLAAKEQQLNTALAEEGKDEQELATLRGELAQVQAIKEELDPVATQAAGLVAAPAGEPAQEGTQSGEPPEDLNPGAAHAGPGGVE